MVAEGQLVDTVLLNSKFKSKHLIMNFSCIGDCNEFVEKCACKMNKTVISICF